MKNTLSIIMILLILTGCSSNYEYWDISQFNMAPSALEDGEEVKLVYTSQGPDYNKDEKYFIHLITVSQKTGDTVNVLTTTLNHFTKEDSNKVFNYFDPNNPITKLSRMDMDEIEKIRSVEGLATSSFDNIKKVARDPEYDYIADNNYPTVIGTIGISEASK